MTGPPGSCRKADVAHGKVWFSGRAVSKRSGTQLIHAQVSPSIAGRSGPARKPYTLIQDTRIRGAPNNYIPNYSSYDWRFRARKPTKAK